ncbi:MAG TPA: tRNA epoxyqueuosine(34) reductase QueG [Gemmatimonadales bacterium]|nr:tRNA epoxyqueuosine(34) reductase QueG [Gemmatimonadales bacterium]
MTSERAAALVKQRALALGFDAAGVADLTPSRYAQALDRWLDGGMAAGMHYMKRQARRRKHPEEILAGAVRAVMVTKHYLTPDPPAQACRGRVAKYARGRDYHKAVGKPLELLADYVQALGPPGTIARPYVDAGPVPERELAARAGLGWIGKNTLLIDPARGSLCFLGAVLTSLDLAPDLPFAADRCGSCRKCLEACPTGALIEDRVLDARLCISYWTIEHRGAFPPTVSTGDWLFGCDACQDVCPWNERFAAEPTDDMLEPEPALASLDVREVATATDAELTRRFGWTGLRRAGPEALRRNARAVLRHQETAQGPDL